MGAGVVAGEALMHHFVDGDSFSEFLILTQPFVCEHMATNPFLRKIIHIDMDAYYAAVGCSSNVFIKHCIKQRLILFSFV